MTSDTDGDLIAILEIAGHGRHRMTGPVTIGRDPSADSGATIGIDGDPLVSKSHLCIDVDQGDLIITDLGSSNGTFLHHSVGETAVPSDRWIPIPVDAEIEFGDQRMTIDRATAASPPAIISEPDPDFATVERPAPIAGPRCVNCERDLPPRSKFCDGCGTPVMPAAKPQPPEESADRTVVLSSGGFVPGQPPPPQPPVGAPAGPAPVGQPPTPTPLPPSGQGFGAPIQQVGGPVFVDPAATSGKGGAGTKILIGVIALLVAALIAVGLVVVLGGDDDASVDDRPGGAQDVTAPR